MTYSQSIDFLYSLQKHGIKLGLQKPLNIMSALKQPQNSFKVIHTAGTNGKGSTSAIIASLLIAHGYKVGLFTSPHMLSFTERITVNNTQISPQDVVDLTIELKDRLRHIEAITFFEFITAMAFIYFQRKSVDWAVVETGMGGRLDATNVVLPVVSVITKIDLDHQEFLGDRIEKIAFEKAGIIKENVPVVSSSQADEALKVLESFAKDKLYVYNKDFFGKPKQCLISSVLFDYIDDELQLPNLNLSLAGRHQVENACVALHTVKKALNNRIITSQVYKALNEIKWHGRLQIIRDNPLTIIDGAHNPNAVLKLVDFIQDCLKDRHKILIFGMMSDKAIEQTLHIILPLFETIIFTAPQYDRSASPELLKVIALRLGYKNTIVTNNVVDAIRNADKIAKDNSVIIVTGSFYLLGDMMQHLGHEATMKDIREGYAKT